MSAEEAGAAKEASTAAFELARRKGAEVLGQSVEPAWGGSAAGGEGGAAGGEGGAQEQATLALLPASSVVHVGDSYSSDVAGAKRAGCLAVWLSTVPEQSQQVRPAPTASERATHGIGEEQADAVIASLLELEAALDKLEAQ